MIYKIVVHYTTPRDRKNWRVRSFIVKTILTTDSLQTAQRMVEAQLEPRSWVVLLSTELLENTEILTES